MTYQYKVGESVIISRESKVAGKKTIGTESATVVKFGPQSVFVQLANKDVIKRKYRQIKPISGGTQS